MNRRERGATSVEYGLLIGLIAIGIIGAAVGLKAKLASTNTRVATALGKQRSTDSLTITAVESNGTITATVTGGTAAHTSGAYIFLDHPDACETCYSEYVDGTLTNGAGTFTFAKVPPGAWQARFVANTDGVRTFFAASDELSVATTSLSLVATQSAGNISVQVTGGPTANLSGEYLFLEDPSACDTCYSEYVGATLNAGAGTFVFNNVPSGNWQARFVLNINGERKKIGASNTVAVGSTNMQMTASASSGSITVTITNGPTANQTGEYVFLETPGGCDTCYSQYVSGTLSGSSKTVTFSGVPAGNWQARYVTNIAGVRARIASSNIVSITGSTLAMTATASNNTITVNVTGGPTANVVGEYIFLDTPGACDTCYAQYVSGALNNGTGTFTFDGVPAGTWQARYVTNIGGVRAKIGTSNNVSILTTGTAITATAGSQSVNLTVTGAPTANVMGSYLFLAHPGDCDTCYSLYQGGTFSNGSGSFTFTGVPSGTWQVRYLFDIGGTRTVIARGNTVTVV